MIEAISILATAAALFVGLPMYLTRNWPDEPQPDAGWE